MTKNEMMSAYFKDTNKERVEKNYKEVQGHIRDAMLNGLRSESFFKELSGGADREYWTMLDETKKRLMVDGFSVVDEDCDTWRVKW